MGHLSLSDIDSQLSYVSGYNSTIHHGNGKQAAGDVSTCEINDQVPTDKDEDDSTATMLTDKTDQEFANDKQSEAEDVVTPIEQESTRHVQCKTSTPVVERALSDGSMVIDMQVDMTTQKLTVLKINQLLRRTKKLLTTSQKIAEETMETKMDSNELRNVSSEMTPEK